MRHLLLCCAICASVVSAAAQPFTLVLGTGLAVATNPPSGGGDSGYVLPDAAPGLVFWLNAASLSGSDGDAVAAWNDSSANAHNFGQATSGNRPILTNSTIGFNSKKTIWWDGSNDSLTNLSYLTSASNYTLYAVLKPLDAYGGFSTRTVLDAGSQITLQTVNSADWKCGVTDRSARTPGELLEAVPTVLSAVCNSAGTALQLYTNGVAVGSAGAFTQPNLARSFTLGALDGGGSHFQGTIAQVIVYNAAHGTSDRQGVESYLGTNYGITITH